MVPMASLTWGCCCSSGTSLSLIGAELSDMTEEPGGRIMMSAPTPRARRAVPSSVP